MSEYWGSEGPDYDEGPDYSCGDCDEKQAQLDNAVEFLEGVLNQLYGIEDFSEDILESSLCELCAHLGVTIPSGDLCIKQK